MKKQPYNHNQIEEKWQRVWEEQQLFQDHFGREGGAAQAEGGVKQASDVGQVGGVSDSQAARQLSTKEKIYLLFAFAYPSGLGLHVGHVESKTALDILARYYRMQGKDVFFPVGWDAFGLPAENYAIKTGTPPKKTTKQAIDTFRRQIKRVGISYDWANELATCHPEYYKWTQWIFLQLFKEGLACRNTGMVNWCPSCQTVLAHEQVVEGQCERCDTEVMQKDLEQWYFKITQYKDELISGLEQVDWPSPTVQHQLNWIGKKEGINIDYQVEIADVKKQVNNQRAESVGGGAEGAGGAVGIQSNTVITCFTTRPDTNFGATFIVLAPEHDFAQKVAAGELVPVAQNQATAATKQTTREIKQAVKAANQTAAQNPAQIQKAVAKYIAAAQKKTELERQTEGRNKTGVFTGFYAINNLTGKKMPIWISDFVLGSFGTGAVVGVPGHDKRDFEFAQKFDLEVIRVVVAADGDASSITKIEQVQEEEGTMVNSEFLNGLNIHEATQKVMDHFEKEGCGKRLNNYKLRDWLISRQRYWGTPIPIIYDPDGHAHAIKEEHLPWKLATDVDFKPTGESPLKSSKELLKRTQVYAKEHFGALIAEKGWDANGKGWLPEFDTMDTFVDSSWYFLRYLDSRNQEQFVSSEQMQAWMPVDLYLIGPEHIVLHLLYARFFTKFLRDEGYLKIDEPFAKMRHQGMVLGPDGKKMSKSKGNVINPDETIEKFGADTLRVYEMFMGPLDADKAWETSSVKGVRRFLDRIYHLVSDWVEAVKMSKAGGQTVAGGQPKNQIVAKSQANQALRRKLHQTIRKVTADIPKLKFNTAIAAMMEFMNHWGVVLEDEIGSKMAQEKSGKHANKHAKKVVHLDEKDIKALVRILAPFAPFLAEELWQKFAVSAQSVRKVDQVTRQAEKIRQVACQAVDRAANQVAGQVANTHQVVSIHQAEWPSFDPDLARSEVVTIAVQVNGKVRGELQLDHTQIKDKDKIIQQAKKLKSVKKWLGDKELKKAIYVEGKIVSLVM